MSGSSQFASNSPYVPGNTRSTSASGGPGFEQSLTQAQTRRHDRRSGTEARTGSGDGKPGENGTSGEAGKADHRDRVTRDGQDGRGSGGGDERKGGDGDRRETGVHPQGRGDDGRANGAGGSTGTAKAESQLRFARDDRETQLVKRDGDVGRPSANGRDVSSDPKSASRLADAGFGPSLTQVQGGRVDGRSGIKGQGGEARGTGWKTASGGIAPASRPAPVTRDDREAGDGHTMRGDHADRAAAPVRLARVEPGVQAKPDAAKAALAGDATFTMRIGPNVLNGEKRDPASAFADNMSLMKTSSSETTLDTAGSLGLDPAALGLTDVKAAVPSPLPLPKSLEDDLMRVNAISQQVLFDKTAKIGFAWENGHNFDVGEYGKLDTMKKAKLLSSLINTKAVYFAKREAAVPGHLIVNDNEIVAALDRGIKTLHGDPAVQNFFEEEIGPEVRRRMWRPENSQLLSRIMRVAGSDLANGGILGRATAAGKGPNNTLRSFAVMAGAIRQVVPSDLWQQMLPGMQANVGKFIIDHAARTAGEQAMQTYMGVGPLNRASVYDPAIVEPSIAMQAALLAKRTGAPQNEALRAVATLVARTSTLVRMGYKLDNALFKARDEFRYFRSFPGSGTMAWRAGVFHAANAVCSGMQIAANNIGKKSLSAKDKAALAFQGTMAADLALESATKYTNAYPALSRSDFGATVRRLQRTFFSPSNIDNVSEIAGGVAGLGNAVLSFMSAAKEHDVGAKILDTVGGIAGLGSNAAAVGEAATYFLGHEDAVVTRGIAAAVGRSIGLGTALGEAASGARLAASVISGAVMTASSILGVGAAIGQIIAYIVKGNHQTDNARNDIDDRLHRTVGMSIEIKHFTGPGGLPNPWDPPVKPYVPVPTFPG